MNDTELRNKLNNSDCIKYTDTWSWWVYHYKPDGYGCIKVIFDKVYKRFYIAGENDEPILDSYKMSNKKIYEWLLQGGWINE